LDFDFALLGILLLIHDNPHFDVTHISMCAQEKPISLPFILEKPIPTSREMSKVAFGLTLQMGAIEVQHMSY
jgi:hypothetical protein